EPAESAQANYATRRHPPTPRSILQTDLRTKGNWGIDPGCKSARLKTYLFRHFDTSLFADDGYFYLSRVMEVRFDFAGDASRQLKGRFIVNFVRLNEHAQFPASLHGEGLLNASEGD